MFVTLNDAIFALPVTTWLTTFSVEILAVFAKRLRVLTVFDENTFALEVLLIVIVFDVVLAAILIPLPGTILSVSVDDVASINEEFALTVAKELVEPPPPPEPEIV